MHWDLTIDVNWLINIDYFLCYCWDLDCLDYLLYDLEWHFFLNFNVLWHLNDFLHNPLRSWDSSRHFNNDFNRFLDDNFLDNLLGHNRLMSCNLCISVFQEPPQHFQINLDLVLFAFKSIKYKGLSRSLIFLKIIPMPCRNGSCLIYLYLS